MWKRLARLSNNMRFVGVRGTNTTFFVDIGWAKLALFWINGSQREDSNKAVGILDLCGAEDFL